MSDPLRDLVGQSLMLAISGQRPTPDHAELLARTRACGVILFSHNVASPEQLGELCAGLQEYARHLGLPPLLIAIDQEGGTVSRLPDPFAVPPSQQALAAAGADAAYAAARLTAAQLRACGVNVNFAPLLDVNNNPDNPVIGIRSFGADVATVRDCGLASLRGHHEAGVIATVKHFPGHGDTTVDSHLGLPDVPHARERLDAVELAPFRAAFDAGAPAVMVAHVVFRAVDARPATLSPAVMRNLLRDELGYDGLVVTDALDMAAIADQFPAPEAAVLAKAAGADVVLPLGDAANHAAVADALLAALEDGRVDEAEFRATVRRLERLRTAYSLAEGPGFDAGAFARRLRDDWGPANLELGRRCVSVRDPHGLLPLASDTRLVVVDCLLPRFNNAEEAETRSELLQSLLRSSFPNMHYHALPNDAPEAEWAAVRAVGDDAQAVLLVTRNAWFVEHQAALGAALAARTTPLIHLAARSPYDAERIPGAAVTMQIYGDPPVSLAAAIKRLAGEQRL